MAGFARSLEIPSAPARTAEEGRRRASRVRRADRGGTSKHLVGARGRYGAELENLAQHHVRQSTLVITLAKDLSSFGVAVRFTMASDEQFCDRLYGQGAQ